MNSSATASDQHRPLNAASVSVPFYVHMRWLGIAVLGLAAALRLLFLAHKSLWLDEALGVAVARTGWADFARSLWQWEGNMALYYVVLRPFLRFSDSEFWVRLPSALAGIATVPVIYSLGKTVFDRRTGLVAAVLLSVNACHVVYSQEARGYSLVVFLSTVSSLLFLRALEDGPWKRWLGYAVASALAIYSHFFAGLVVFVQWLWAVMQPRRIAQRRRLWIAAVSTVLLSSPAVAFVLLHNHGQLDWVPKPSFLELYRTAIFLAAEGGKVIGDLLLVFCLLALVRAGWQLRRERHSQSPAFWREILLWCWLLVPILVTLAASIYTPIFFHRFLIICLPAFVLLVAHGLLLLPRRGVVVTIFTGLSLVAVFQSYSRTREDWRAATAYIVSNAEPGDAILFHQPYCDIAVAYYEARLQKGVHPVPVGTVAEAHGYRRLWVVLYPASGATGAWAQAQFGGAYATLLHAGFRGADVMLFDLTHSHAEIHQ